jgi:hypothetical protein
MIGRKSFRIETDTETPTTETATMTGRPSRREITQDQIARRAYEISQSPNAGSPEENWYRAERELRARA